MTIEELLWDEKTLEKITQKHQLGRQEIEEVFENNYHVRRWEDLYYAYGQSVAGRYIFVVLLPLGQHRVHVVTARDMTLTERRLYLRARKG